ncbi:MAG: class I SAM-dependent methyltransferase [Actinophytocola sp.]|uniref:class I SAM-dependent methyltransferase n=1 Tax=Actinophytocola sp. TaxID=1872138 RepID=UPI003D6A0AF3
MKTPVELHGVAETLLWPLYCRANETRRPDALLRDPLAVEVCDRIEYPFEEHFGRPSITFALRAVTFDDQVRKFLAAHPDGTVVALGEGLDTQFWRVDNGRVRWVAVDLDEAIEVRRAFLPDTDRHRSLARSALDLSWLDEIDPANGVLVTAQGLLMYFEESDAQRLLAAVAERFPGGEMLFDVVPGWAAEKREKKSRLRNLITLGKKKSYSLPPWKWGATGAEMKRRGETDPNVAETRDLLFPRGRGMVFGKLQPHLDRLPFLRNKLPCYLYRRFTSDR